MKNIYLILLMSISFQSYGQTDRNKIDSLRLILKDASSKLDQSNLQVALGEAYTGVNLDSATTFYRLANTNALTLDNKKIEFASLIGLGSTYSSLQKLDSALVYFQQAENLLPYNDSYDAKTKLGMGRAIVFFYRADYDNAKAQFQNVLDAALAEEDQNTISRCYNNIALCLSYTGSYQESLEMHMKSASMAEAISDTLSLAKSYNNMGLIYQDLDDLENAEQYLLRSLALKQKLGSEVSVVGSYLNLGNVFRKKGVKEKDMTLLTKAQSYYKSALELGEKTNYRRGINNAYVNMALVATSMDKYDEGIAYGKQAVKLNYEAKNTQMEMIARINLGDAYRKNKEYALAETEVIKGLALGVAKNELFVQKEAQLILTRLFEDQNKYQKAFQHYEQYVALNDSVGGTDVKNKVAELETRFKTQEKERALAESRANLAESELKVEQRNVMIYGGLGLVAIFVLIGYLFFSRQLMKNKQLKKESELQEALARIETQNRLQEQRLRISRDLHDNIGAQLTFVTSSVDNLKFGLSKDHVKVGEKLENISEFTTQTIYELRDTIWAMNKNDITLEDMQIRIANFIDKARSASSDVSFSFDIDTSLTEVKTFTSTQGMNLYRIIQESVNNALKYAQPNNIDVRISEDESQLLFTISDDGSGFDIEATPKGNGLVNMEKRIRDLGGAIKLISEKNKGTTVLVSLPKSAL